MPFTRRWNGGIFLPNLGVIWEMPVNWLKRNGFFLNLFFGAITSFSLLFALYVYNQSEILSEITYHTLQEKVFDPSGIEGISAAYSGESFDSGVLQKISITVWNSGRKSLDIGDVRQKLALRGDGFEIIEAKIVIQSPDFSGFRINEQNDLHTIEWDFFDAGNFFVVDLFLHSDSMDTKPILALEATKFAGLVNYCESWSDFSGLILFIFVIIFVITLIILIISIPESIYAKSDWIKRRSVVEKTFFAIAFPFAIFVLGMSILIFTIAFIPAYFFNYYELIPYRLESLVDIPNQIRNISCRIG